MEMIPDCYGEEKKEEWEMSFLFEHTALGFCWWDLPALIILIVVIVVFAKQRHDLKKQEKDLEDELSALYADDAVELEAEA